MDVGKCESTSIWDRIKEPQSALQLVYTCLLDISSRRVKFKSKLTAILEFSAGETITGANVAESNVTLHTPWGDVQASKLLAAS